MSQPKGSFIVTGANGGLGSALVSVFLESPEAPLNKGLFAVRNSSSAEEVRQILSKSSDAKGHEIISMDLSSLAKVRAAAKTINDRVSSGEIPPIRTLVLNAALQHVKGLTFTDDKFEATFAVNYLANFLLVLLLLQSMDKVMGRIVIVSSWTHDPYYFMNSGYIKKEEHKTVMRDPEELARPAKDDPVGDKYGTGMRRYGMSKTVMIMFMYELQRRLSQSQYSDVSVLAVDPGAMPGTSLLKESPAALLFLVHVIMGALVSWWTYLSPNGLFRTTHKSALDLYYASFDEKVLGKHPKAVYLNGNAIAQAGVEAKDEKKQKQLWNASVRLASLEENETVLSLK